MDEKNCGLESLQKNPFNITCTFCNEIAHNLKKERGLTCNEVVHGYGNVNAEILIVGEGPGQNGAAITGIPFTKDQSGKRMQIALIKCELSESNENDVETNKNFIPTLKNAYITNLYRFYGYNNLKGLSKKKLLDCSSEHLKEEKEKLRKVKHIIPVGKKAQDSIKRIFHQNIPYVEHPSTRNGKTLNQWVELFIKYYLNNINTQN